MLSGSSYHTWPDPHQVDLGPQLKHSGTQVSTPSRNTFKSLAVKKEGGKNSGETKDLTLHGPKLFRERKERGNNYGY